MPLLLLFVVVGVVFARKQFTYLELLPGIYIIEGLMVILVCSVAVRTLVLMPDPRPGVQRQKLVLPPVLAVLGCSCLIMALSKAVIHLSMGGESAQLQELPILVYPFFWVILLVWLSLQSQRSVDIMHSVFGYAVLLFPIYFAALHSFGVLEILTLLDKPFWPNNNYVFATCLLVAVFQRDRFPAWLVWSSTAAALYGVLVEAQRGTFVCLFIAFVMLMRRFSQALQLLVISAVAVALVSLFGQSLSFRFEQGASDLLGFFASVTAGSDDPRYSSTEHRGEMWVHVVGNAMQSLGTLTVGKPIAEPIVPEAWRNPHNGYLSALGRGGLLGLAFYLILLADSVVALLYTRTRPRYVLVHIFYFAGCVDAMTQTVFDSPYSLFLVLMAATLSIHARLQRTSRPAPMVTM